MKAIQFNKELLKRREDVFVDYDEDDKETAAFYLGEALIENTRMLDKWLSDVNGYNGIKLDPSNPAHARMFAKLDAINDELSDIVDQVIVGYKS